MVTKTKRQVGNLPIAIVLGLLVNLMIAFAVAATVAFLISEEIVAENAVGYGSVIALLLSAFLGALVAAMKAGERRVIVCIISGAVYFLSLLCFTAMFCEGEYEAVGVSALVIFGGSIAAGLLGFKTKGKGMRMRKKLRF